MEVSCSPKLLGPQGGGPVNDTGGLDPHALNHTARSQIRLCFHPTGQDNPVVPKANSTYGVRVWVNY